MRLMRRTLRVLAGTTIIATFLVLTSVVFAPAFADVVSSYPYPGQPGTPSPQSYGQTQSYSVLFRGNGEAVVWATVSVTNGDAAPVSEISLTTPGMTLSSLEAWQEIPRGVVCWNAQTNASQDLPAAESCDPLGVLYSPIGFKSYYYQKLSPRVSAGTLTVSLFSFIQKDKTGTILLSYRGTGMVKAEPFGRKAFEFKTLAAKQIVRSVSVSADVDTDLYLAGKRADVNYAEQFSSLGASVSSSPDMGVAASAPVSRNVGVGGSIYKTASELSPGDTLRVRGVYASSVFGLIYPTLGWGLLPIVLVVVALFVFRARVQGMVHNLFNRQPRATTSPQEIKKTFFSTAGGAVLIGFLNAVGTALVALFVPTLFQWVINTIQWGSQAYLVSQSFVFLFMLVMFLLFAAVILGPAVYYGFRRGRMYGITVGISQIGFLVIIVLFIVFLFSFMSSGGYPGPMPLLERSL